MARRGDRDCAAICVMRPVGGSDDKRPSRSREERAMESAAPLCVMRVAGGLKGASPNSGVNGRR